MKKKKATLSPQSYIPTRERMVQELQKGEPLFILLQPYGRFAYNVNQRFMSEVRKKYRSMKYLPRTKQVVDDLWNTLKRIMEEEYKRHKTIMRCRICGKAWSFEYRVRSWYEKDSVMQTEYPYAKVELFFHVGYALQSLIFHVTREHFDLIEEVYQIHCQDEDAMHQYLFKIMPEQIARYLDKTPKLMRWERITSPSFTIEYDFHSTFGTNEIIVFFTPGKYPSADTINRSQNVYTKLTDGERERLAKEFLFPNAPVDRSFMNHGDVLRSMLRYDFTDEDLPSAIECVCCHKKLPPDPKTIVLHCAKEHPLVELDRKMPTLLQDIHTPAPFFILRDNAYTEPYITSNVMLGIMPYMHTGKIYPVPPPHLQTVHRVCYVQQ